MISYEIYSLRIRIYSNYNNNKLRRYITRAQIRFDQLIERWKFCKKIFIKCYKSIISRNDIKIFHRMYVIFVILLWIYSRYHIYLFMEQITERQ